MPFVDANLHLREFDFAGFDHAIIGAGAAGILLAVKLSARGKRVVVIESGHYEHDDERQNLNAIEETGKRLGNAIWNRKRILGGTTTAWGGQSLPFTPIDFSRRDWVANSGWPISIVDLQAHYRSANAFMGVDVLNYDSDMQAALGNESSPFDARLIYHHYSKWAPEPNFFNLHRRALDEQTTVLYNAHLLRIDLSDAGRVDTIQIANFADCTVDARVSNLILATGGLESVRTLLLNDHQIKGGLGSGGGWLGKAFMEHPCLEIGDIETADLYRVQALLGTRLHKRRRYNARLGASEVWQRETRSLNISAGMMWLYEGGEIGPLGHLREFSKHPSLNGLGRSLGAADKLAQGLWALATKGVVYKPGSGARMVFTTEQSPDPRSYIALSERRDKFGKRQAKLHWQIGVDTWTTIVRFVDMLSEEISRLGLGALKTFERVNEHNPDWQDLLSDVNHHMGGARMSQNAGAGVVDQNLAVWGAPNLFVCSAAVFPTGFHSNPTLTVLALGDRLVDHLAPS